jgi:hypothetical protein
MTTSTQSGETVKILDCDDVIYVPPTLATCPSCSCGLFALIQMHFVDTGVPVEDSIYVGCVECDAEICDPTATNVRQWISSNHRVKT